MHESVFSDSLLRSLLEEPMIDGDGLVPANEAVLAFEGLVTVSAAAAAAAVDDEGVAAAAAA